MAQEVTYTRGLLWRMLRKLIRVEHPEWDDTEVIAEVVIAECGLGDYAKYCADPRLIVAPILEAIHPDDIAPLMRDGPKAGM